MKATWGVDRLDDQSGRRVVVTGANSGIGYQAALALARRGAHVVLACRSEARARDAIARLSRAVPHASLAFRPLDLADLASVREFAAAELEASATLDLLINNAGVMMPPKRQETADGFELQFGVNHLGHFALTGLLLPALRATPEARVVTVASQAHRQGRLDFDDPQWTRRRYSRVASYGQSKLANLLFTAELARRAAQPMVVAAHPGYTATELQRHLPGGALFNRLFAMQPRDGALPTLRAAVDPEALSGDYFGPSGPLEMRGPPVRVTPSKAARDAQAAARLWALSEELTGVSYP